MTRDQIIILAFKCHLVAPCNRDDMHEDQLVRFAELVAVAEREACAKVCDDIMAYDEDDPMQTCADAIRAMGTK